MQLSRLSFISKIHVCDPYLDEQTFEKFKYHVLDKSLVKNSNKISIIEGSKKFDPLILDKKEASVFLDFTYFRTSLKADPHNFRHHLKTDLIELLKNRKSGSLVCGNMAQDEYVREVLEMFAKEANQKIEVKGNIGFFKKNR